MIFSFCCILFIPFVGRFFHPCIRKYSEKLRREKERENDIMAIWGCLSHCLSDLGSVPTSCTGLQTRSFEQPTRGDFSLLSGIQEASKAPGTGTTDAKQPCLPGCWWVNPFFPPFSSLQSLLQPAVFFKAPSKQG